jgi:voltage-gated potassium channel
MTSTRHDPAEQAVLSRQRWRLLSQLSSLLDKPMTILAFVWLVLLIVDFTQGLSPRLQWVNNAIWIVFILHFALEFWIAPNKLQYLRRHWLTAIALALPALRVLRVFRALRVLRLARVARSVTLLRLMTGLNRGMRATQRTFARRGLGYVIALTLLVNFAGAAGIYTFENPAALKRAGLYRDGAGVTSYGEAVWWTAMMLTTVGSEYWPRTSEGRLLSWLLAFYAVAIFGYIAATFASFIIQKKASQTPNASQPE